MSRSKLFSKDDYWSIWIGAFLLLFGLVAFLSVRSEEFTKEKTALDVIIKKEMDGVPFQSVEYLEALEKKNNIKASSLPIGKFLKNLTTKPASWNRNPLDAFVFSQKDVDKIKTD